MFVLVLVVYAIGGGCLVALCLGVYLRLTRRPAREISHRDAEWLARKNVAPLSNAVTRLTDASPVVRLMRDGLTADDAVARVAEQSQRTGR